MSRRALLLLVPWLVGPAAAGERLAIGVPDFTYTGYGNPGVAAAARGAVEEELSRSGRYELVERQRLADLLDELGYQQGGVTPPEGAAAVGQGRNVQLLLFGQLGRLPNQEHSLSLRVVDVASNRVLRSEQARLPASGPAFDAAVRRVARQLVAVAAALYPSAMALIPGGRLSMGADRHPEEGPVHAVAVDTFHLDLTEVSRAAFAAYVESLGRPVSLDQDPDPDHPAVGVSWHEAAGYCAWVGKRLPTEAEWELAARGPEGRLYPWGAEPPGPQRARLASPGPVAVDALPGGATPEGVLHLAGNAGEWVADWWDPTYYRGSPERNPAGPPDGDAKVVRGGGFHSSADELRGAARFFHNPDRGAEDIGFRCAASTPPGR